MKKHLLLLTGISAFLLLISCEQELEESVFHPDPDHPDLPEYSEWGYNTFGAYYDRKLFSYNDYEIPAKVISNNGATLLMLKGSLGEKPYYSSQDYIEMSLSFMLKGFVTNDYTGLAMLNDTIIDLTNSDCAVFARIDGDSIGMQILSGNLQVKKAQHLFVDNQSMNIILSGYFGFQAIVHGEPITMSYGRFDVGIGTDDFYQY
jgi:hypothetical protein